MKYLLIVMTLSFNVFSAISFEQYNQILDEVYESYFEPIYQKNGWFYIQRSWNKPGNNAKAHRRGPFWMIELWGGYAGHELTTLDGFTALTCHEVGHHLGGAPYSSEQHIAWSTTEPQADYFVTTKCLRKLWYNQDNQKAIATRNIHPLIFKKCFQVYGKETQESYLCVRSVQAGYEMLLPFKASFTKLAIDKPNNHPTKFTFVNQHAGIQCRLDTLFQGALCPVSYKESFGDDLSQGACTRSTHGEIGSRPRCWYLPPY